jgi:hypothetical protein
MTQDCRYLPLSCGHLVALQVKGDHGHVGRAQREWRWDAPPLDARGGPLTRISEGAYGDGLTGLVWVGPLGAAPAMSQLVEVHFRDVATRGEPPCSRCGGRRPGRTAGCSPPWMPISR